MTHTPHHRVRPELSLADEDLTTTDLGAWMSHASVCQLLGESRSTVDKWRARGVFPKGLRKPNGKVMFRRNDVAAFIAGLEEAE